VRDFWRALRRNRLALIGGVVVACLALLAILAPVIAPWDPNRHDVKNILNPPSHRHVFGTDQLGRDVLSRMLYGARVSLAVGILAQGLILVIGLTVGGIAGFFGGRVDNLLMRFTDVFYAFPDLLFVIIITAAIGSSFQNIIIAIGLVNWTDLARLVRGSLMTLRERDFISAAHAIGAPAPRIITQHLLPNSAGPIIVRVTYGIPQAIFAEAVLSFIGLGIRPPDASWGTMIERGNQAIFSAPHMVLFPALAIAFTMLAFNFLGDGLRDALDPQNTR